ncbi:Putative NAD(P)H nitroreductase ydjA [Providencia rettgeri]|uniref:NAD(P)H nitroreductase ydjA n=1 Tax=Providencia rettgeri TaxID=587 RepID=A0A379FRD7_PRORE|nr:Putative NAD(P)H nitroreductase ydjA [Providencia rettgeri]
MALRSMDRRCRGSCGLGCGDNDRIVGFLYLGTPELKAPAKVQTPDMTGFVSYF